MLTQRLEVFRKTVAEIGIVPVDHLSAAIAERYGMYIAPAYIPVFHAMLEQQRQKPPTTVASLDGTELPN